MIMKGAITLKCGSPLKQREQWFLLWFNPNAD